jgi:hypothetical protein
MKILVCGGRNYAVDVNEYKYAYHELDKIVCKLSDNYNPNDNWLPTDITIIHGGANGADRLASDYATVNYCQEECYPADWNRYGKSAGYIRNRKMLEDGKPDLVVAFPGGKGTEMMVGLATKAKVMVIRIDPPPIMQGADEYEEIIKAREMMDQWER